MMTGITGTPGTGKSTLGEELSRRGHPVMHLVDTLRPYILEHDETRDTDIVDEERWAEEFPRFDGIVEGHLAHYLPCDLIVILRCRPDVLEGRLRNRGYIDEKVRENVQAEALDVILQETVERFREDQIYEIDGTTLSTEKEADIVEQILRGDRSPSYGMIDWSSYLRELI